MARAFVAGAVGGVFEPGGVLDGEAVGEEGVGSDDAFLGEAGAVVEGFGLFETGVAEGGDGVLEGGGVFGGPAVLFEGGGVTLAGGEDDAGAGEFGGEGFGLLDADLEFAVEFDVIAGKGEAGAASCAADESFEFLEGVLLGDGEGACFAGLGFVGGGAGVDGVQFGGEPGGVVVFGGVAGGVEALGHGGEVGGVNEGVVQGGGLVDEGAEGEGPFAGRHIGEGLKVERLGELRVES